MRTDWIPRQEMGHLLAALTPANRLVMEIAVKTGLRISDVLSIKTGQIESGADRITVRQLKTGKTKRVWLGPELVERCQAQAGRVWVFEHRYDAARHRTREAVYKDLTRVAKDFRLRLSIPRANIAPHSARKIYAVDLLARTGDMAKVQRELCHASASVTALYAMADVLTRRRLGRKAAGSGKEAL